MPRPLPPASADPFTVDVSSPRGRAVCIHGYTGSPYEVLPVALALKEIGVASVGIVLPGHEGGKDGDPHALNRTSWEEWAAAGARAFDALPSDRPRFLIGCSMGALVALSVAAARPGDVDGLVLLAPAMRFFRDGQLASAAARRGLWRARPLIQKTKGSDIADDDARARNPSLPWLPLRGIGQLGAMQDAVEVLLPRVVAPVCLVHGAQDHTIPPTASEVVARGVASSRVEHHVLRDSFHVVGIDVDRDQVCALAQSFVDERLAARAA